jgi:hypothetical protein
MQAAEASDAERQRLRARLREYAREAEAIARRQELEEALAIREAATASAAAELLQIGPEQTTLAAEPVPEPVTLSVDDEVLRQAQAEAERLRQELLATKLNSSYNLVSMQVGLDSCVSAHTEAQH